MYCILNSVKKQPVSEPREIKWKKDLEKYLNQVEKENEQELLNERDQTLQRPQNVLSLAN